MGNSRVKDYGLFEAEVRGEFYYFINEKGEDFYELTKRTLRYSFFLLVDPEGRVLSGSSEMDRLSPFGARVVGINAPEIVEVYQRFEADPSNSPWLVYEEGDFSVEDHSSDHWRELADNKAAEQEAKHIRQRLKGHSLEEMSTWPRREEAALAVLEGHATDRQLLMLHLLAEDQELTTTEMADKILEKAELFDEITLTAAALRSTIRKLARSVISRKSYEIFLSQVDEVVG